MTSLKKNLVYNFIYQILILLLPLATAPYLSRVVMEEGVGVYSFSYSVALYFTYFTLLGMNNYGSRSIAAVQNDLQKRSALFCQLYGLQMMSFAVSIILYVVYVIFFSVDRIAALIMLTGTASALFDINWFFFGMEKFRLTVTRNALIKLLTVICIFVFVRSREDIYIYILIMGTSMLLSQLCLWPFLRKYIRFVRPSFRDIIKHLRSDLVLFIPVIAISVYKIMDKIMLGYICNMSEVGYYENAEKIINISLTLIISVGTVMMPRMTALISAGDKKSAGKYLDTSVTLVSCYCIGTMCGLFVLAPEFSVVFYGEAFRKSGTVMILLAVTIIFLGVGNVIRTQYLIPMKKDRIYITSALMGAAVNLVVNIVLIPIMSSEGAAVGTIAAEVSVFLYQVISVRRRLRLSLYIRNALVYSFFGIIMMAAVILIPPVFSPAADLILRMTAGAAVYSALSGVYLIKKKRAGRN